MNATPASIIEMRCVPTHHSAISLAAGDVASKVLGSTPGPLYLAALMDAACTVKSVVVDDPCGEAKTSCAMFDNREMFMALAVYLGAVFKAGSFVFVALCYRALEGTEEGETPYDADTGEQGQEQRVYRKLSVRGGGGGGGGEKKKTPPPPPIFPKKKKKKN